MCVPDKGYVKVGVEDQGWVFQGDGDSKAKEVEEVIEKRRKRIKISRLIRITVITCIL